MTEVKQYSSEHFNEMFGAVNICYYLSKILSCFKSNHFNYLFENFCHVLIMFIIIKFACSRGWFISIECILRKISYCSLLMRKLTKLTKMIGVSMVKWHPRSLCQSLISHFKFIICAVQYDEKNVLIKVRIGSKTTASS